MMESILFYNGTILTMEEPLTAQAVLTEKGRIKAMGLLEELKTLAGPDTRMVDLGGQTLLPGFIDPHSHITALAQTMGLLPLEGVTSWEELAGRIRDFRESRKIQAGEWITGFGYDHNFLREKAHPSREMLDKAAPDNPVLLSHASGHMGVMNTAALKAAGITADTPDPTGGKIGRTAAGEPDGYLEEAAFTAASAKMPRPSMETLLGQMEEAQQVYLSHGITTVQDGVTKAPEWAMLKAMAEQDRFLVDVVSYVDMKGHSRLWEDNPEYQGDYCHRLRLGGYKIFLDGSPQGRTAWVSRPYENGEEGYCGYPIYEDEEVESFLCRAVEEGRQILAHCNGDAAAQQMLDAYERAGKAAGCRDIRPVMIHAQLVRRDQLSRMARLGMIASFFVAHTYYWGDIHLENFGRERACAISPAASAIREGVTYTFHQDTPVLPPDMLQTVWCAVNRVTKNGEVLGEEERISPLDALKGVTINAAYQYFEEDRKGSIRPGKTADLVVLDRDPLEVPPEAIREIRVTAVLKEGRLVYGDLG